MPDAYYLQLRDRLAALIADPARLPEGRLPPERMLAERFQTTRITLRQALAQLEGEGRIYRSNRRGWFVSPERLLYDPTRDHGFTDYVTAQGRRPRTEVLGVDSVSYAPAAKALGLATEQPLYRIRRRRYVDERPVLVESVWLVPERVPGLLDHRFDRSLWELMRQQWHIELERKSIRMYPEGLSGQVARELGVGTGCAGLFVSRASFDTKRRPVEYDEEHWLHDALCIAVEI